MLSGRRPRHQPHVFLRIPPDALTMGPTLSVSHARQLAITRQGLAGNHRPTGILDLVRQIGCLQLDPINVVARSHLLVLWSRLGTLEPAGDGPPAREGPGPFGVWAQGRPGGLTED